MPRVHRNLHSLKPGSKSLPWSLYRKAGDKVQGTYGAILCQVVPKDPSGQAFEHCRNGGHRAVFAWLKCAKLDALSREQSEQAHSPSLIAGLVAQGAIARLRLDPKAGDAFFHANGQRYTGSRRVFLLANGSAYTSTENLKND